jgi:hypothetical protein
MPPARTVRDSRTLWLLIWGDLSAQRIVPKLTTGHSLLLPVAVFLRPVARTVGQVAGHGRPKRSSHDFCLAHSRSARVRDAFVSNSDQDFKSLRFRRRFPPDSTSRVGIKHQFAFAPNLHNPQQPKPLRSFINIFKPLKGVSCLQELLWNSFGTIPNLAPCNCETIILLELTLEVCPAESRSVLADLWIAFTD